MNLQMELSSVCNLSCVECPQRLMKRKKEIMSDKVFDTVLDYIGDLENKEEELGYPPTIIFHKDGEPLLHPSVKSKIGRIALLRPEFRLNLYTNGLRLTDEFVNFLSKLPNRVWLLVSFHFFNADGSKNDYSKVTPIIQRALEANYRNIDFAIASHVTRFASEEFLNEWVNSWGRYQGTGNWAVHLNKHINPWTGLIQEENCVTFDTCPYADFGHLFVGATGNVIPCCMDLEEEIKFGNVLTHSQDEIYKTADSFYTNLRSYGEHRDKNTIHPLCQRCLG